MAEIKDKVVTVEALSTLHNRNENTYMTQVNPTGRGTMSMEGEIHTNSIMIGTKVKLVPTGNALEIVFLEELDDFFEENEELGNEGTTE